MAVAELARVAKPGARLLLTAPLGAGLHQEPFHFYGGFTPHWWRMVAERLGLDVVSIEPNGGFLKLMAQECARVASTIDAHRDHHRTHAPSVERLFGVLLPSYLHGLDERAPNGQFTVGYHVELRRPTNDQRIAQLTQRIAATSQDIAARYELVDLLRAAGRQEEAIIAESQASACDIDDGAPLPGLANCLYEARMATEPTVKERILRQALAVRPYFVPAMLALGKLLDDRGEEGEALALYEAAAKRYPGAAVPWTQRALLLLRHSLPAPAPRASRAERVTVSTLGNNGRFANQVLQYMFLRLYAELHGLEAQAPDWIGRPLFGAADPLPTGSFERVYEQGDLFCRALAGAEDAPLFDHHDLWGYFCYDTDYLAPHRDRIRGFFRPVPALADICRRATDTLRQRGTTLVALHIRHGDFGADDSYGRYRRIPLQWYQDWLAAIWPSLDRPVLYLATDDPSVRAAFADYRPATADDLGAPIAGAEFFLDFFVLTEADWLGISNSTFGFVASLLNARAQAFARPDSRTGSLAPFDPWSAPVQLPTRAL
jgi:tetratricopeptide (TPR) repeat protein